MNWASWPLTAGSAERFPRARRCIVGGENARIRVESDAMVMGELRRDGRLVAVDRLVARDEERAVFLRDRIDNSDRRIRDTRRIGDRRRI